MVNHVKTIELIRMGLWLFDADLFIDGFEVLSSWINRIPLSYFNFCIHCMSLFLFSFLFRVSKKRITSTRKLSKQNEFCGHAKLFKIYYHVASCTQNAKLLSVPLRRVMCLVSGGRDLVQYNCPKLVLAPWKFEYYS